MGGREGRGDTAGGVRTDEWTPSGIGRGSTEVSDAILVYGVKREGVHYKGSNSTSAPLKARLIILTGTSSWTELSPCIAVPKERTPDSTHTALLRDDKSYHSAISSARDALYPGTTGTNIGCITYKNYSWRQFTKSWCMRNAQIQTKPHPRSP